MSAIWALRYFDGRLVEQAELERMGAALAAWGPEAQGTWRDGAVGLGHGLMAFTPEDLLEKQPVVDRDRQSVIVFDGRVDNRPELARELSISPSEQRQLPDSTFALRAYERWGEGCHGHLIGALAFIVWDGERQRLFAACTPGNNRTLFYYQTAQVLALATVPRGLLALPFVPHELNHARMANFMLFAPSLEATFYRGITRLMGGHSLVAQAGQVTVRRYWLPELASPIRYPNDDDYVEAFNELFERVVDDHLRSLTPIGVLLSGGLDSSAVAVTAAGRLKPLGRRLAAFTEVPSGTGFAELPPGRYADETAYVRSIVARHDNLELNLVRTDAEWFVDGLPELFDYHEAPVYGAANLVWLQAILRSLAERGLRVALTGEFGNLSMSYDGQGLLADYVRQGRVRTAWAEARGMARAGRARSSWRVFLRRGLVPLLPASLQVGIERLRRSETGRIYSPVQSEYAAAHADSLGSVWRNFAPDPVLSSHRARLQAATQRVDSLKTARSGQFGVDLRDPSADQRLIEFCLSIPSNQFLRDGRNRWLIRRAMADRLPGEVLWNTKRGMQAADWFARLSAHRGEIGVLLARFESNALARQVLDLERLRGLLVNWPAALAGDSALHHEYSLTLQQGLMVGSYLLWFDTNSGD